MKNLKIISENQTPIDDISIYGAVGCCQTSYLRFYLCHDDDMHRYRHRSLHHNLCDLLIISFFIRIRLPICCQKTNHFQVILSFLFDFTQSARYRLINV